MWEWPQVGSSACWFFVDGNSTLPHVPLVIDEFRLGTFNVQVVVVVTDGDNMQNMISSSYLHPTEKLLSLQIETDKAEYRPGERCTAVITARDHRGRPVPRAAISLGVVDQAIYQMREDPLPDLFQCLTAKTAW